MLAKPDFLGCAAMTTHPQSYACIYVKEFSAQAALRVRPELRFQPFVVMDGKPPMQFVCSQNARARAAGTTYGMTRTEVETIPSVKILSRAHSEESAATTALIQCAGEFSSRIEQRSCNNGFLCLLDIAGTERLFGSAERLSKLLHNHIRSLGMSACVATSSNADAAVALARSLSLHSPVLAVPAGQLRTALSRLPLSVLDLSDQQVERLSQWGICTVGMLADLPETELIARFGQDGKRLLQLAKGELQHLFQPIEQMLTLEEHIELDTPLESLDRLLFVIAGLLEQLTVRASSRFVALSSVTVSLQLEGNLSHTRTVRPALPSNERSLWLRLLHLDLGANPPHAAIAAVTLSAEHAQKHNIQLGIFTPQLPEPSGLDVTLARIAKIVGSRYVGCAVLHDTHQPDSFHVDAFRLSHHSCIPRPAPHTRSAIRQLRPHEYVRITTSESHPKQMHFRDQLYVVERAYGPWLTGGEWWNSNVWNMEQWDIVARGAAGNLICCCVSRDLIHDEWRMVSVYD